MGFFDKMFSGKNKGKENGEADYLTEAYDSLGDEDDLNPDKILDEVGETVLNELNERETEFDAITAEESSDGVFAVEQDLSDPDTIGNTGEMDPEEISRAADFADAYVSGIYGDREEPELEAEEAEPESEAEEAVYGRDFQSEPEPEFVEDEAVEEDISDEEPDEEPTAYDAYESGEVDRELLYSAYAPKSMRPKVTETAYYDLDDPDEDEDADSHNQGGAGAFIKKHKGWFIGAGVAAAVVLIVLGSVFFIQYRMNPLGGYAETYVAKGNIIKTMSAGGNVEPNARYNITSLVSGTVTESPLNAGEAVKAGELVYKIDDTNAQIAVQQAENAVQRAQVSDSSSSNNEQLRIYANATGTISGLNISAGSTVNGGQIAVITQANGTEIGLIPSVTGTVQSVSVRNGASVTSGQVIATLRSNQTTSTQGRELDLASSKLALEQAEKELEKYKIASPIDGTILIKNAKVGDNVGTNQSGEPLMVIADMSRMKFTIEVDELDIWNIELGQTVVVTANALPGETFSGEITNIAGEGEKRGNGVTVYPVEITISDPGKIKSGMNVDAKIIINSSINVLTLPAAALYASDGTNALVITDSADIEEDALADPAEYPDIYVPKGYKLARVEYGLSDGTNVEILSGLSISDKVLYVEDEDAAQSVQPARDDSSSDSGTSAGDDSGSGAEESAGDDSGENVKSTGKSATQEWISDIE